MEFSVGDMAGKDEFLTEFALVADKIRVFVEPARPFPGGTIQPMTPCNDIQGAYWIDGTDTRDINVETSAVALVFAYELQQELNIPIGIIDTAISGTMISTWLSREATENNKEVLEMIKNKGIYKEIDDEITSYHTWTVNYNSKIAPLAGLNLKGTIWYQGESDIAEPSQYIAQLDLLKESWGKDFGFENDDMPFIYTQVAPDCYDSAQSDWFKLGYMAEAMTDAYRLNENNNTAMITIYDVALDYGMQGSIHPNTKIPVGERFAQSAINLCYNGGKEASAPLFKDIKIKGNTIYVNFTHVGNGLECFGKDIHGFNIAGEDGVYVNAKAKIVDKDTVMVWNDNLKSPKFANMNQAANLINSEGIPAAPFRSDRNAATYLTIEEWMFADADAFESKDTNLSAVMPSWTVSEGASYAYNESVKTEGKASLAVTRGDATEVSVSPVINSYDGKAFNLANYNSIKLDVKTNAGVTVQLVVNDTPYGEAVAIGNDGFNTVLFNLENIEINATVTFKISGLTSDVFYLDDIAVGMTDTAAVFGDVNDNGEFDNDDLVLIRKQLLSLENNANLDKADANKDGNIDICDLVRTYNNVK